MDTIYSLIANHGIDALAWILSLLALAAARWFLPIVRNTWARGVIERAGSEVRAAVLYVAQTYVDAIKAAREDGKLTADEKDEARRLALSAVRSYLGTKGLKALSRALGAESAIGWLIDRAEAEVQILKQVKAAANPPPA